MAEISSLLGLITDDNTRQALIAQMENMFDNAPDEERLIQEIGKGIASAAVSVAQAAASAVNSIISSVNSALGTGFGTIDTSGLDKLQSKLSGGTTTTTAAKSTTYNVTNNITAGSSSSAYAVGQATRRALRQSSWNIATAY